MEPTQAAEGAGTGAGWSPGDVLGKLADRLASADARTIYGNPIERDGLTVIPVAKVRYGFGGGVGRKKSIGQEGTGAGGGVHVTPVGFIEMGKNAVRFRRIRTTPAPLIALSIGLSIWLLGRVVRAAAAAAGKSGRR